MKIVQFSRPPTPLVQLRPKFFHLLGFGRPLSPNENQSIKRKQSKDDYYMLSGLSFRLVFVFIINSLILSGSPLISFYLTDQSRPQSNFKKLKIFFAFLLQWLPFTVKKCVGVKIEMKAHYLLFRSYIFLCVQLSKNIRKCFLSFF